MRSLLLGAAFAALLPAVANASGSDSRVVVVTANFGSRTSLRVSSELLHFQIASPGESATAEVNFTAAARTAEGAEVMLSVEGARFVSGPGGAGDVDAALMVVGILGTQELLSPAQPTVVGRWTGSGTRSGRVLFSLRAGAVGSYTVPLRFVLSAP